VRHVQSVPKLHLTKVAFACRDLDALQDRVKRRAVGGEIRIATRMRPKRADELIGGNLYWIVRHTIIAGLEILRFEDREDGRIDIVCSAELRIVSPISRRAHQGWRYLEEKDAPGTADHDAGLAELPPHLYGRLTALALV
jgi:hypothetical protein